MNSCAIYGVNRYEALNISRFSCCRNNINNRLH